MDFVKITKDYRAQEQRMRDNTARLIDEKRRYNELMEKKRKLQNQDKHGNISIAINSYNYNDDDSNRPWYSDDNVDTNSYGEWEDGGNAQDI
jgi:hypothetical protein